MTRERAKQLPSATLTSEWHSVNDENTADIIAEELEGRGYKLRGFSWTKDENAKDPVEELRKRILG